VTVVVKAKLPDGTVVPVETRGSGDPEVDVGIGDKVFSFEGVSKSVESVASAMTATFDKIKPDKATVEFGVDISVESGALSALIVKGSGSATLTITLEWGA
jgi:hypothetical protein